MGPAPATPVTRVLHDLKDLLASLHVVVGECPPEVVRGFLQQHPALAPLAGDASENASVLVYFLELQLLYYAYFTSRRALPVAPLEALQSVAEIQENLDHLCTRVGFPELFGYNFYPAWDRCTPASPVLPLFHEIAKKTTLLVTRERSREVLVAHFHAILPKQVQKTFSTFYTSLPCAEFLAWLAVESPTDRILDPACGSGGLLISGLRRKVALVGRAVDSAPGAGFAPLQPAGPEIGVDLMKFATILAALNVQLAWPVAPDLQFATIAADFLTLTPDSPLSRVIPSSPASRALNASTANALASAAWQGSSPSSPATPIGTFDVILQNPPFTRQETLSSFHAPRYKQELKTHLAPYASFVNEKMGYHGYFLLHSDGFLRPGGRLAAILPATTLRLDATRALRYFWVDRYQVEWLVYRTDASAFSLNTSLREVMIVLRKRHPRPAGASRAVHSPAPVTRVLELRTLPDALQPLHALAETILALPVSPKKEHVDPDGRFVLRVVSGDHFAAHAENWYLFLNPSELLALWEELTASTRLVPHPSLVPPSRIIRGVESPGGHRLPINAVAITDPRHETGYDKLTFLQDFGDHVAVRVHDQESPLHVPKDILHPALRSFSQVQTLSVSDARSFFITGTFPGIDRLAPLARNPAASPPEFVAASARFLATWAPRLEKRTGHLFLQRRVNLAAPGTHHLAFVSHQPVSAGKMAWVIHPADPVLRAFLGLWYNSSPHLLQVLLRRIETEGAFVEFGKYLFDSLRVPDWTRVPVPLQERVVTLAREIEHVPFPALVDQLRGHFPARVRVDDLCLEIAGITKARTRERLGHRLRTALAREIARLGDLMK